MHGRVKSAVQAREASKNDDQKREERAKIQKYHEIVRQVLELKRSGRKQLRLLPLTSHLLLLNPEFHIVWSYRREILEAKVFCKDKEANNASQQEDEEDVVEDVASLLQKEFQLTMDALKRNPKSYATWYQRQWLIDHGVGDLQKEIGLCNKLLNLDERNFHCWNYRRHVAKLANISQQDEFAYSTEKIEQNFSNYSALHHRSILLPRPLTSDTLNGEIELVQQAVFTEPDDQSAWFYYRWLFTSMQRTVDPHASDGQAFVQQQIQWMEELVEIESQCKWALNTLAFLYNKMAQSATDNGDNATNWHEKSSRLYETLQEIDPDHRLFYRDMQSSER